MNNNLLNMIFFRKEVQLINLNIGFSGWLRYFFIVPAFLISSNLFGQMQPVNVSIIPPSPNVAALNKYIDVPVNTYTGIPSITIPLYEIKVGTFTIPINLNYHAGGHKVEDVASWVGLGWSLTGAYQISRSLVGLMDESTNGFLNAPAVLEYSPSTEDVSAYSRVKRYLDLEEDSEPDIFYINTNTANGKFLLDKQTREPNFIPHQKVRLNYSIDYDAIQSWTMLNTEGVKYLFDKTEATTVSPFHQRGPSSSEGNSAWWVSSIEFPDSDKKVTYTYNHSTNSYFQGVSHSSFYKLSTSSFDKPDIRSYNRITAEVLLPRTIYFPGGQINFVMNDSSDFQRCDIFGGRYLKEVIVTNDGGYVVKRYKFNYSYFSSNGTISLAAVCQQGQERDNLRLKLNSVTDISDSAKPLVTHFDYEESVNLPNRITSFARDHWGFYNGKESNLTLLPKLNTYLYQGIPLELDGADRSPSELHTRANVLKQIKYPTGGNVSFTYEVNDCENEELPNEYSFKSVSFGKSIAQVPALIPVQSYNWRAKIEIRPYYLPENGTLRVKIFRQDSSLIEARTYVNKRGSIDPLLPLIVNVNTYGLRENLLLVCEYIGDELSISDDLINVSWTDEVKVNKKKVGGLRVRSVRMNESAVSSPLITEYLYHNLSDTSISSGSILNVPHYEYIYTYNWASFLARTSIPNNDLGFTQGSPVGYKYVTVRQLDSTGKMNGKTEYEYTTSLDFPDMFVTEYFNNPIFPGIESNNRTSYPFVRPAYQNEWRRGQLLSKKIYSGKSNDRLTLVSEVKNIYKSYGNQDIQYDQSSMYINSIRAAKAYVVFDYESSSIPTDVRTIVLAGYKIYTGMYSELKETIEKEYKDGAVITQVKIFDYDTITLQTRRIQVVNSKGEKGTTELFYPTDVRNIVSDSMVKRNIISPVLEQSTYLGNKAVEQYVTNFSLTEDKVLKTDVNRSFSNAPLERIIDYEKYDTSGNILQVREIDGVRKSFIWGYNLLLPVAQVINSEINDIASSSFETNDKGNWIYPTSSGSSDESITGKKSYFLSHANYILKTGLNVTKQYTVTYWLKNGSGTVSIGGTALLTRGDWTLYQVNLSGVSQINISGTGIIDELRLYPKDAQMTTYTYEPLVGITSQCDPNNRITYYEYDAMGRLKLIRDQDRNIIKTYQYNYKQ